MKRANNLRPLNGAAVAASAKHRERSERIPIYCIVTIVKNGNDFCSIDEIDFEYNKMQLRWTGKFIEWSAHKGYELKKNNVIHMHTYISCANGLVPYFKCKPGWNIQIKKIDSVKDLDKVRRYILKNKGAYDGDLLQLEAASYLYINTKRLPPPHPVRGGE